MRIPKPKTFNKPSKSLTEIFFRPTIVYHDISQILEHDTPQLFDDYFLHLNEFEIWSVKASEIKVRMDTTNDGYLSIKGVPLNVEFYESEQSFELHKWCDEIQNKTNLAYFNECKRNILLVNKTTLSRVMLYGAYIWTPQFNTDYGQRFNIDPIMECQILYDRYEYI